MLWDSFKICRIEAASEMLFEIGINSVKRATDFAAYNKYLIVASFYNKAFVTKFEAVKFT